MAPFPAARIRARSREAAMKWSTPWRLIALLWATIGLAAPGFAQPFPSKPVKLIAPYSAGARPGTVSYGSSYVGSPSHLGSAQFEYLTGTKMIHVPYRDQSQMYVGIANGDVGWAFSTLGSALPLIQAGRIKILAIAAKQRLKTLPDVPTVA